MLCRYCSVFYKLKVSGYSAHKFWCHFSNSICLLCVIFGDSCSISNSDGDQWSLMLLLQERYNLLKTHLVISIIWQYFLRYLIFFRHSAIAYLIYHSINICTGKHKKFCDSLCCDSCFIVVVWIPTCSISKVCLKFSEVKSWGRNQNPFTCVTHDYS